MDYFFNRKFVFCFNCKNWHIINRFRCNCWIFFPQTHYETNLCNLNPFAFSLHGSTLAWETIQDDEAVENKKKPEKDDEDVQGTAQKLEKELLQEDQEEDEGSEEKQEEVSQ